MTKPFSCRTIARKLAASSSKPIGIPRFELDKVTAILDELEVIRLADLDGLCRERVAEQMSLSQPTLGSFVEMDTTATIGIVHTHTLRGGGGPVRLEGRNYRRLHDEENSCELGLGQTTAANASWKGV